VVDLSVIHSSNQFTGSWDSSVGIATRYGLEGPGIESQWGEIFRTYRDRLRGPPSLLYNGYRVFPGGKGDRGVMLTTHPLPVLRLRKSWAIPPLTLRVLLGLVRGSLYQFTGYTITSGLSTKHIVCKCALKNYCVIQNYIIQSWVFFVEGGGCPRHFKVRKFYSGVISRPQMFPLTFSLWSYYG
jgi:hypothetical protein